MALIVTTTGLTSSVSLPDLGGRVLTHTFSGDFELEFHRDEILNSDDLQLAIDNGFITVTDSSGGTVSDISDVFMFKSTYDTNLNDIADNSSQLEGFGGSYYLDLNNATGSLPTSVIQSSVLVSSVNSFTGSVSLGLQDLDDVQTTTPGVGEVLYYDGTTFSFQPLGGVSVTSVNSQIGVVVLDTDDINEGVTNLYFTNQRARDVISIASGSENYLGYSTASGELSIKQLAITDVTVDTGVTASAAAYFSANYTGTEYQEGDYVVLAGLTDGQESWIHNGGTAGTISDFTKVESPHLEDSYIKTLFSGTAPIDYNNVTGEFSLNGSVAGNGLTYSTGVINVQVTNGLEIVNDTIQINDDIIAGNGLTAKIGRAHV